MGENAVRTYHEISINKIVQRLQENAQQSKTNQETGECGNDPVNVLPVSSPSEPENTGRKGNTSSDDFGKSTLR